MKLVLDRFAGEIPQVKPLDLPPYAAEKAQNVYNAEGRLAPLKGLSDPVFALAMNNVKSIYPYGAVWFSWQQDVNVCRSPVVSDPWDRIYWTGQGAPRFTASVVATASPPYPSNSFLLGVPAPVTAPIATLGAASGTNTDYADDETRFYVVTHVNAYGEEGAPSPVSNRLVLVEPLQPVQLNLPTLGTNTYGITRQRIYRTASGSSSSGFYLVAELPINQTTHTDALPTDSLGAPLVTQDYDPPPADMKGLTMLATGIMAGFVKNTLHISEAYLAYAWPKKYRLTTQHNIVAMAATTNALVVATEGFPYVVSGVSPDSMSPERLETNHSCLSARSMVDMGEYVIYASPDGLVGVSANQVMVLTKDVISPRQWREKYNPASITGIAYDGKYLAFYTLPDGRKGGFIFDGDSKSLMPVTEHYGAVSVDLAKGNVHVLDNGNICQFDRGAAPLPLLWRSKPFVAAGNTLPNALRIDGSQLNQLAFSIRVDGSEKYRIADCSKAARAARLPALRGEMVQFELSGTGQVDRVVLASEMEELL